MARMTARQLSEASPTLEIYRATLLRTGRIDAGQLELELCKLLGDDVGYQEMKDLTVDLLEVDRYRLVALRYMEESDADAGVVSEFKPHLAAAYGLPDGYYDCDEDTRDAAREAFWRRELPGVPDPG